jgi:hypothetical protein
VSARIPLTTRRVRFLSKNIETAPCRSRAQEVIVTGAIDRAVWMNGLAHDLTNAVMSEISKLGRDVTDVRSAVFTGIAYGVIDRIDRGAQR